MRNGKISPARRRGIAARSFLLTNQYKTADAI
jgi:hypothetical protein